MLENVLSRNKATTKTKIAVKSAVSAGLVMLAVALPQLVHLFAGAQGGAKFLPMYLPIILGGCVLGSNWGLAVAMLSPVVSFIVTSASGEAMPSFERLPFMMAELAVFAFVCGLFSKKIEENSLMAFPAVILSQLCGRAFFVLLAAVFNGFTPITLSAALSQVKSGIPGLAIQAVVVPITVIVLQKLMTRDNAHE